MSIHFNEMEMISYIGFAKYFNLLQLVIIIIDVTKAETFLKLLFMG